MNHLILLAGGVGSRFWPLSRQSDPKQFLAINSKRPLLEDALLRIGDTVPPERTYIATALRHASRARRCARPFAVPQANFLFEPSVKSTLAPIALLSERIYARDPQAVIAVVPCDHFVRDEKKFRGALRKGFIAARTGTIVTFGFPVRRPETGYGYIQALGRASGGVLAVRRFLEKPTLSRARRFMRDRHYFWNGGIFIFPASLMAAEVKRLMPRVSALIGRMTDAGSLKRHWHRMPAISIDYAVMEKTRRIALIPASYGWIDVGSWQAVYELMPKDARGNVRAGKSLDIGSRDSLVWSTGRLIATVGLRGLIIVDSPDALLVCAKERHQDVKKVVEELKKKKYRGYV